MIMGVDHCSFVVSNLGRSVRFYEQLGLRQEWEIDDDGPALRENVGYVDARLRLAQLVAPDGARLELIEYVHPRGEQQAAERNSVGAGHICLLVDDIDSTVDTLRAHGIDSFLSGVVVFTDGPDAGLRAVYLHDPDGIIVELSQAPPEA
jgi:catechol 2,3-dioxygenase-like lactoylglutathione lyase family enzyme